MRVIAGQNKGRTLRTVAGRQTRPTTDKVKETIFNMIGPFFQGGNVLDLYAGSGGLAIEALSRGAEQAVLVDKSAAACRVIRENLQNCRYEACTRLLHMNASLALELLSGEAELFDYIFLDPPYAEQQLNRDIQFFLDHHLLQEGALIIAEHEEQATLPEHFSEHLERWKYRTYQQRTAVSIYLYSKQGAIDV